MLKYLVIMLDDTSVSYCNYENRKKEPKLIGLEDLKAGIVFAMKRNLTVQFVYPDYELPQEYKEAVDSIDHCKIVPYGYGSDADVVVLDHPDRLAELSLSKSTTYLLRSSKNALFKSELRLGALLGRVHRLNLLLTDIQTFTDADFQAYSRFLGEAAEDVLQLFLEGKSPQLNVLTDRLFLGAMNNCNAAEENITLAPDGRFYVCPAFYQDRDYSLGDIRKGLDVKNSRLYKLQYAPICRTCDAFQCRRCIWLNRKLTLEVNTPGREQCVIAHLERDASRKLLIELRKHGNFCPCTEICELDYLDPMEAIIKNR